MKVGDECWLIIEDWCSIWGIVRGRLTFISQGCGVVYFDSGLHLNPRSVRLDLLFPTREALCEHYRKIFE